MRLSVGGITACLLLLGGSRDGFEEQTSFRFEFQPPEGRVSTTIFEMEGELLFNGLAGLPDRSAGRLTSFASETREIVEDVGDAVVISVTFDSIWAQYRVREGAGWIPLPVSTGPIGPFRWSVDRRLGMSPLAPPADPWDLDVARGLTGMPNMFLPEQRLAVGDEWRVTLGFPFTTQIPSDSALLIAVTMSGRGVASLDSVVPRTTDTLAYVSLQATLDEFTVPGAYSSAGGDLPVTVSGTISSVWIWSTGWQAWASGAQSIQVDHLVVTGSGTVNGTMQSRLTSRFRIRP